MISIVIPTFNHGHALVKCLDSIQRQSYLNFEIIIVDDGSTDNSREILEAIPYIKLVNHKINRGYSSSLKTGISNSISANKVLFIGHKQPRRATGGVVLL